MKFLNIISTYLIRIVIVLILSFSVLNCSANKTPNPPNPEEISKTKAIDDLVYRFMSQSSVPGATLAIAKDGQLVYAKAYGFADEESGDRMKVETRSRISSISKTITSIAVMKLIENDLLDLDDKIFGDDGILKNDFGNQRPYKQFITDLTVKHCLSHHVGGWGNASNDPTMLRNELNASDLLSYIIDNIRLDSKPGLSYAYSNVGFLILGRVIEKITGKTYEQYVKETILSPIGINNMEIGGSTFEDKKLNETRYHNPKAYTQNFSRRDANGGWIATTSDLVKLFVRIDGSASVPDILNSGTLQLMTTPPFSYKNYALGIMINGGVWYHGGSFNGSRSHWMRTPSGYVAAIMINGDANNLKKLLEDIVATPITWGK